MKDRLLLSSGGPMPETEGSAGGYSIISADSLDATVIGGRPSGAAGRRHQHRVRDLPGDVRTPH
jgi:hypothetical protein